MLYCSTRYWNVRELPRDIVDAECLDNPFTAMREPAQMIFEVDEVRDN